MKNETKRVDVSASAVIINADVNDFRRRTKNRERRLCEACRAITDEWLPKFRKAASDGCESVISAWRSYHRTFFHFATHPSDEPFRYAALFLMLNSIERGDSFVFEVIDLINTSEEHDIEVLYPSDRFKEVDEMLDVARTSVTPF